MDGGQMVGRGSRPVGREYEWIVTGGQRVGRGS